MTAAPSEFMLRFLMEIERFRSRPYADAGGLQTIGFGHLIQPTEMFDALLLDDAKALLRLDTTKALANVEALVPVERMLTHEIEACASLVFNIGAGNFKKSTLRDHLVAGRRLEAGREFRRWYFCAGKPLTGLRRRRGAEEVWFLGGHPDTVMAVLTGVWA